MNKDPFSLFNLNEFKKWMSESPDQNNHNDIIGKQIESKISFKKLLMTTEVIEGEDKKVLKEFHTNGGYVIEKNGNILTIETTKGKIETHKMYVRIS